MKCHAMPYFVMIEVMLTTSDILRVQLSNEGFKICNLLTTRIVIFSLHSLMTSYAYKIYKLKKR